VLFRSKVKNRKRNHNYLPICNVKEFKKHPIISKSVLYYIIYSFLSSLSSFSSFILLIFSFTSPLTLLYLPSACFFLSPVTLPAASFTFPLILSLTPSNFSSFLLLIIYFPLLFIFYTLFTTFILFFNLYMKLLFYNIH